MIKLSQIKANLPKMPDIFHILQPKHTVLKDDETEKLLKKYNVSLMQVPKIKITDPALPKGANIGDVIKIERKDEDGLNIYYRVVIA